MKISRYTECNLQPDLSLITFIGRVCFWRSKFVEVKILIQIEQFLGFLVRGSLPQGQLTTVNAFFFSPD